MHQQDSMTPRERMKAFAAGEPMDRYPIMFSPSAVCARVAGMTQRQRRSSAGNTAKAQVAAYRRFGQDRVSLSLGVVGVGAILGSRISDPENAPPAMVEPVLKDLDDLAKLDPTLVSYEKSSAVQMLCDAGEMILEEIGDEVGVSASVSVMTAASGILGTERLMRAVLRQPEKLHQLLRFTTDISKQLVDIFCSHGLTVSMADPVASGSILRKAQYETFVKPYTIELVDYIHSKHLSVGYHICGKTSHILDDMADTGCNTISLDNSVDLHLAKELVGQRVCLMGNVDPVGVMLLGTPEQVEQDVKRCFGIMYDSPKGYILSAGCEVPANTPDENLDAFMAAGRYYGKYPYRPELYV